MTKQIMIYTVTKCGRCNKGHSEEGSHEYPPVGWASAQIICRKQGAGWTHSTTLLDTILCPECAEVVAEMGISCVSSSD